MATTTFMTAPRWLFTSESVTEGHPDKLCDQISDAVLDAIYQQDAEGRVACETLAITVECFGTNRIPEERILRLVEGHFDLRPRAIIRDLRLQRPISTPTACYGHFGRMEIDAPWEQTDKAEALRHAAGFG